MKLTPKQKAFADYYIECGNAAEAARRAGYSERYAGQNADKLLKNTNISAYIAERMGTQDKKRVADADEVMEFYTAVMRGEVKDQFGLDTALSDRLKAGTELMKRYSAAEGAKSAHRAEDDPLTAALKEAAKDGIFSKAT